MTSREAFRVLLVEDDERWRAALKTMYQAIFESFCDVDIVPVYDAEQACGQLERSSFDLMSLDILLGKKDSGDGQMTGVDVMEFAARTGNCGGVVVISGLHDDPDIEVVFENGELQKMKLVDRLVELFKEGRSTFIPKSLSMSPEDNASVIRDILPRRRLLKLAMPNRITHVGDEWTIVYKRRKATMRATGGGMKYIKYLVDERPRLCQALDIVLNTNPAQIGRFLQGHSVTIEKALEIGKEISTSTPFPYDADDYIELRKLKGQRATVKRQIRALGLDGDSDKEIKKLEERGIWIKVKIEQIEKDLEKTPWARARKHVGQSINDALARLETFHPDFCSHFAHAAGWSFSGRGGWTYQLKYNPDPPVFWLFD